MSERKSYKDNGPHYELGKIFAHGFFDLDALLGLASKLRDGIKCSVDKDEMPSAGCLNWVVFLTFSDGMQWVFRAPMSEGWLSDQALGEQISSEVATMKYIKKNTRVPVPEVFSFCPTVDNPIGVPYILMSKIPGRSLGDFYWHDRYADVHNASDTKRMTNANREKIMFQLGAMFSGLAAHRFNKIGSLFEDTASDDTCAPPVIGKCLSPGFFWENRETLSGIEYGPFSDETEHLMALIHALEEHSRKLYFTRPCLLIPHPEVEEYDNEVHTTRALWYWGAFTDLKKENEGNEIHVDHCILTHILREMVPHIVKRGEKSEEVGEEIIMAEAASDSYSNGNSDGLAGTSENAAARFVIVHPDLHGGNIFVDDDFNITGILDWSSATTGSVAELLASPKFRSVYTVQPSVDAAFRKGFRKGYIAHRGTGHKRIIYSCGYTLSPAQWEKVEMVQHASRLVNMGVCVNVGEYYHFRQLHKLIYGRQSQEAGETSLDTTNDQDFAFSASTATPPNDNDVHCASPTRDSDNGSASPGNNSDGDNSTLSDNNTASDTSMTDGCCCNGDNASSCECDCSSNEGDDIGKGCSEDINDGYDYDNIIVDLFRQHREMPYAKAELARLKKEDDGASDDDDDEDGGFSSGPVNIFGNVARKLAVMESLRRNFFPGMEASSRNFFPDRRLWQWISEVLAEQTDAYFVEYKEESRKRVEAYNKQRMEEEEKKKAEEEKKKAEEANQTGEEEANSNSKEAAEVEETVAGLVEESLEVAAAATESVEVMD